MRIVFMGTPEFALPTLKTIYEKGYNIVGVVCQPDRAGNRGKVEFSPIKKFALEKNLPLFQFASISKEGEQTIKNLKPDVMITAAFGQILRQNIIDIAPIYNVHASILPKYRGAAPINEAIINGEKETGVTIMKTDIGLDTGDILLIKKLKIGAGETAGELTVRVSNLGAEAMVEALELIKTGKAVLKPQDNAKATHFKTMKKEFGLIDFNKSAKELFNFIRGLNPWPGAFYYLNDKLLKVHKARVIDAKDVVENIPHKFIVKCGKKTFLELLEVQPEGKRKMTGEEFLRGNR